MRKFRAKICQHIVNTLSATPPDFCSSNCKESARLLAEQENNPSPKAHINRDHYEKRFYFHHPGTPEKAVRLAEYREARKKRKA